MTERSKQTPAKLYIRRNGTFGASCAGVADTGHEIFEDSGRFTVWSVHDEDRAICTDVTRQDAEAAIAKDWLAARAQGGAA